MKFATLALIGTVAALNESAETLIAQKAELLEELNQIDNEIVNFGSTATTSSTPAASTSTSTTTTPAASTSTTTTPAATTTTKKAESSNTGLIIGVTVGVVVLAGVGFYVWKKKQASEDQEGGSPDDLFNRLVDQA